MAQKVARRAELYRMKLPDHTCPWGLKALDLLERRGFAVEDHVLTSRDAVESFKKQHQVDTTPQAFIDGKRIGGYDETLRYLEGSPRKEDGLSYTPVVALFSMAALMALAASWGAYRSVFTLQALEWFLAISVCLLAVQKLMDVERFSVMFLNYDLLAQRWVRYASIYPFAEALTGLLMLAGVLPWVMAPVALLIGTIGAVSVFKAVYVDRRALKCACVGGYSNVPLGFVSLSENLIMIAMAIWTMMAVLAR